MPIIHQTYNLNQDFYIQPLFKQLSLLGNLSDSIVKVIKPLYDIPEASRSRFTIYQPHYKEKIISNSNWTFVCITNCLYFLCNLSKLSTASLFTCDGKAYAIEPGLVTKKRELPRTSLYHLFHLLQSPSPLFSLTIFKYTLISRWQLSTTLTTFFLLANYLLFKLASEKSIKAVKNCKYLSSIQNLPETSLDLSYIA